MTLGPWVLSCWIGCSSQDATPPSEANTAGKTNGAGASGEAAAGGVGGLTEGGSAGASDAGEGGAESLAGAAGVTASGGQGGDSGADELKRPTELELGECASAEECRPVTATGFPGLSADGQSVVVLYQFDPPFDLFVASYDVSTGQRLFTEPVYGADAWAEAQASEAGREELMDLVKINVSDVLGALLEGGYTAMTRFDELGIEAGHDGVQGVEVRWCSVGDCFTENDGQGEPIHHFPVAVSVDSESCSGFIDGIALGAIDTERRVLVVQPRIVANSDLCEVSDLFLVGRYE